MPARLLPRMLPCVALLITANCGGDASTTPTPVVVPEPSRGRVEATAVPNPVPFSGEPITDVSSCSGSENTWFYDQVLTETGGSTVTFTRRVDMFDNTRVNDRSDLNVVVPANGSITLKTRWCSATRAEHSAESTFTGVDAAGNPLTASSGVVRLLAP